MEMEGKVKGHLLDVVVGEGVATLELFISKDEVLLVRWDTLLVLNLGLNIVGSIRRLYFEGDGLARDGLYKDLHATMQA